jgi:hypothetical protein
MLHRELVSNRAFVVADWMSDEPSILARRRGLDAGYGTR